MEFLPRIAFANRIPHWLESQGCRPREPCRLSPEHWQWIKEGKQAVKMTRLSCHRFHSNDVRLWLSVIAYNLGNLWRRLVLPQRIEKWSLRSLQQRLVKTGGRLIKHARYYWLLLAEGHLTRRLFEKAC